MKDRASGSRRVWPFLALWLYLNQETSSLLRELDLDGFLSLANERGLTTISTKQRIV